MFDAQRADEGRQDERRQQRGPEEFAARKTVAGEKDGERDGDEGGEGRGEQGNLAAVDEGEAVKPVLNEEPEETQGEGLVAVRVGEEKCAAEQSKQRIDQKAAEKNG